MYKKFIDIAYTWNIYNAKNNFRNRFNTHSSTEIKYK